MDYYLLKNPNPSGPNFYPTRRQPVLAIVVHITAGLQDLDLIGPDHSAEGVSRYAATTDRDVSWHRSSDSDSEIELLPTSYTAWHAVDYNSTTVGHEISKLDVSWADEPAEWVTRTLRMAAVGPAGKTGLRAVAKQYGVPRRRASRAKLDAAIDLYRRTGQVRPVGFVAHSDLDPTRRRDPGGDFPWLRFFGFMADPDAPTDWLEDLMSLYDTPAEFEAAVAKATAAGTGAALAAWLPRTVAALNGRANSYFADAAVNDDDEEALLAEQRRTNELLGKFLEAQPVPPATA